MRRATAKAASWIGQATAMALGAAKTAMPLVQLVTSLTGAN
jgi:hypothetical protein